MADHAAGCRMAGSYTVTTCPCCGHRITPVRGHRWAPPDQIEHALRERPHSGPFDLGDTDVDN